MGSKKIEGFIATYEWLESAYSKYSEKETHISTAAAGQEKRGDKHK
jgi:hypothetical protein